MEIGQPFRVVIAEPLRLPIPGYQPECLPDSPMDPTEPISIPAVQPLSEPAHVSPQAIPAEVR